MGKGMGILIILITSLLLVVNGGLGYLVYNMNGQVKELHDLNVKNSVDSTTMSNMTKENVELKKIVQDLTEKNQKMWETSYHGDSNQTVSNNDQSIPVTTENISAENIRGIPVMK
jgi:hypothetical protein